jgi:tetratricopeptide (TPR) repeat protein
LAVLATAAAFGCTLHPASVERIIDGDVVSGPFVSAEAYASYARGAYLEQQRDLPNARSAYRHALDVDRRSPQTWVRLGAVECALRNLDAARVAFASAEALSSDFAPLWSERARCAVATGRLDAAHGAAHRAVTLEPDRVENTLLLVDIQERLGRRDEARRWLDGLTARRPESGAGWRASLRAALRDKDAARVWASSAGLLRLHPERRAELSKLVPELGLTSAVDASLLEGRLAAARRHAVDAKMASGELAARAAALGKATLARLQAEHVLQADPTNADAWIASLAALDLSGDEAGFERALHARGAPLTPPGALAQRLFAGVMLRRLGRDAAQRFMAAWPPLGEPRDALERELAGQLDEVLAPEGSGVQGGAAPASAGR